ncbi:MAG: protein serine/threonine phosphatase, partial [Bacteroidetes bacterium]|nr:protein serine/threonine phosphatase [Bacteroidota bacterium]
LKLREEMGTEILMAENYYNIGDYFFSKKDYIAAQQNFTKAVELSERNKDFEKLPKFLTGSGRALIAEKKFSQALPLLLKAENYLLESRRLEIKEVYDLIATCYGSSGRFREAYKYLSLAKELGDSLSDLEKGRINAEMLEKYETDKREKEISILTKDQKLKQLENQRQQERLEQQNLFLLIAFAGILIVSIFAFFLYKSNREKKLANNTILAQKKEVELQKYIIEEKQKEIIDSITYARRIQQSLITSEKYIAAAMERLKNKSGK